MSEYEVEVEVECTYCGKVFVTSTMFCIEPSDWYSEWD